MDRQKMLSTLHGLAAMALTIDELRNRRHKANIFAPAAEPYVKVSLLYGEINVAIAKDRDDSIRLYSSDPNDKADGSIDDAVTVMSQILEELSKYADD